MFSSSRDEDKTALLKRVGYQQRIMSSNPRNRYSSAATAIIFLVTVQVMLLSVPWGLADPYA